MKHKFKIGLAILAVISLPGVLAFADHVNGGCIGEQCQKSGFACLHGAWMMLIDDTTIDNFDNMTLAQIKALEQQKMQELDNLTLAEIKSMRQQKMHERENMTLAQAGNEMVGPGYRCHGKMRPFPRGNSFGFRGGDFPTFMGGHFRLLMDDISTEEQ